MTTEPLLRRARYNFELIAQRTDCIGITLCHVDWNCVHCLARESARELAAADAGTEIAAGPLPLDFAVKMSMLFKSLEELEKVCRRRPEDVKGFYLALATTLGHYKEVRRPPSLSLVPPPDHVA